MIEKMWNAKDVTNKAFGPIGGALGALGASFGKQGEQFGYLGADNAPKYDPKDYFHLADLYNPADHFDPKRIFNPDDIVNQTMGQALRLE